MVICVVAFVVFGILSIASLKYRKLAGEAFKCVISHFSFKPCETKLDIRIKTKLTAKLIKIPKLAKIFYKNFEFFSWVFTILFFSSLTYSGYAIYNLIVHGSCEPGATCILAREPGPNVCVITSNFVMFYSKDCPHCQKMLPIIDQIELETGIKFEKLEIWYNETNRNTMMNYAKEIERDCGFFGVPAFLSTKTNKTICGEKTVGELKKFIIENG